MLNARQTSTCHLQVVIYARHSKVCGPCDCLDYSCVADLTLSVTCLVPCPIPCKLEVAKRRDHECRNDGHGPQQPSLQADHRYR